MVDDSHDPEEPDDMDDTGKVPTEKNAPRKTAAKQTAAKKTPAKKTAAKKTATKKTVAKKTATKKTAAKKTPAKRTPAKKTPAKKTPAKKTAAKKTAATNTTTPVAPAAPPGPAAEPPARHRAFRRSPLDAVAEDARTLGRLVSAYRDGRYRDVAPAKIALVAAGLAYLASPLDVLPEFVPGGFLDDALVIALVLRAVKTEVDAFRRWEQPADYSE